MINRISIEDRITFKTIVEALNTCFRKGYKGWMKAWCDTGINEAAWFTKLAHLENGQPKAQEKHYGCINILSEDGTEFRESHSLGCGKTDTTKRHLFVKASPTAPYRYAGEFVRDLEKSNNEWAVYKRIATELDLSQY